MATRDVPAVFQRPPNHLNPILSDVAKMIPFKNATHGEDLDWTITLLKSNFLETEYQSDPSRIHYIYDLNNRVLNPETVINQQNITFEEMLKMVFTPVVKPPLQNQHNIVLKLGPRGFVSK